jgi:uncharacterized protein YqfA (UPF0365 family)
MIAATEINPGTVQIFRIVAIAVGGVVVLIFLYAGAVAQSVFASWQRARQAGAPVRFLELVAMRLRKCPYKKIVDAHIAAHKAGMEVDASQIEAHHLAGGNIAETVQAIIIARQAKLDLEWGQACAIDLTSASTGQSLIEVVKTSMKTNQPVFDVFKKILNTKQGTP